MLNISANNHTNKPVCTITINAKISIRKISALSLAYNLLFKVIFHNF